MTLAATPSTTLHRIHPGGFFWTVERSDRIAHLVGFAGCHAKLVVVANTAQEAEECAERLTLSGVPVLAAADASGVAALSTYDEDLTGVLVVAHEVLIDNGPIMAPMVVHLRPAKSLRDYVKRLSAVRAPVHLSFVVPEDHKRALSIMSHIVDEHGDAEPDTVSVGEVIDLTHSGEIAMVSSARRRFPLGR